MRIRMHALNERATHIQRQHPCRMSNFLWKVNLKMTKNFFPRFAPLAHCRKIGVFHQFPTFRDDPIQ